MALEISTGSVPSAGMTRISLIWAQARSLDGCRGAIGQQGSIPWHIPEDMRRFAHLTTGHPIVMGRSTWESFGTHRPLPKRTNIVLTRQAGYQAEGARVAGSCREALALAARCPGGALVWIIGGGSIYRQFLPLADEAIVTDIDMAMQADAFAPDMAALCGDGSGRRWRLADRGPWQRSERNPGAPCFRYLRYVRTRV